MPKRPTRRDRGAELAPIGHDHNDLNDEQKKRLLQDHVTELERLNKNQLSANAAVRLQRKKMKADGFSRAVVDYALWLRKVDVDEATDKMAEQMKIAQWLGKPLGFSPDLFAEPGTQAAQ